MAKTLYLHIGTHKTGTKTIQGFMYSSNELLGEYGIAYPQIPYKYPRKSITRNACFVSWHIIDENGERDEAQEQLRFQDCMERVHELFKEKDTVVLSDEALFNRMYEASGILEKIKKDSEENGYTLKLIIYLRRQDQFIESLWNQSIKEKFIVVNTSIESYISRKSRYLEYDKIIDYFAGVVGDENIIVRRFADAAKSGLLQDFLQVVGMNPDGIAEEAPSRNAGLYGNTVRIKQLINEVEGLTYAEQKFFKESLLLCSAMSKQNYPCSEFSEESRREFMSQYEEGNAAIAKRFLNDGKPLFSEDYSGPPKREDINPELISDVVRTTAAADLMLLRENKALNEKVRLQGKQLASQGEKIASLEKKLASLERRVEHLRHPLRTVAAKIKR